MFRDALKVAITRDYAGLVPKFDTAGDWQRVLRGQSTEELGALSKTLTEGHLRVRTNPAAVGRTRSSLRRDSLLLEVYDRNGEPLCGMEVQGLITNLIPPLEAPLGPDGYPLRIRVRYRDLRLPLVDFHQASRPLGVQDELDLDSRVDRLWLLSQLSDCHSLLGAFDRDEARLELQFANGKRYLIDAEAGMLSPNGKSYRLSHRAFLFIFDVLSKYKCATQTATNHHSPH